MIGTMLLHYRILTLLGKGGMGEVYLAVDTRLARRVALKLLPPKLRRDPTRLARFRTEAKAAARLNHPNIAILYALEETDELLFISMEYVPGQPLFTLLPPEGLALAQVFDWFLPLTDALAHAHEHGVTHRDLKPGNIMIRDDGVPKLMDFGLAQLAYPDPEDGVAVDSEGPTQSVDLAREPAAARPLTQKEELLGTPAYMSPEQAELKRVDQRTDLFSWGVVVYEVVTGRRPFGGESIVASLSSVLKEEPVGVTTLKPGVPRGLGKVVQRCLGKSVLNRYQAARDVLHDLQDVKAEVDAGTVLVDVRTLPTPPEPSPPKPVPLWRRPVPLAAAVVLLLVLGMLATWFTAKWTLTPSEPPVRKFSIPAESFGDRDVAIAPNGTKVAYVAGNSLWIRDLNRVAPREIPGTDGAFQPFWSPQSDVVGYFVSDALRTVSSQGGPSTTVCKLPLFGIGGATWGADGVIVFSKGTPNLRSGALFAVSVQGGQPQPFLTPDSTAGYLLYQRGSVSQGVWAMPFDLSKQAVTGKPVLVAQEGAGPSVSTDGTLVYSSGTGGGNAQLVWVDRSGKVEGTIGQPQEGINVPALSPDGRRVAVNAREQGNLDIWIHDVVRGTKTLLTFDSALDSYPSWSPGGDQVAFTSSRSGKVDLFRQAADGSSAAQPLVTGPPEEYASDWSKDGKYFVYTLWDPDPKTKGDLGYLPLTGARKPVLFLQTSFNELFPVFSPDGRYVAYQSDESGRFEVYVKPFPPGEGKWLVSVNGGRVPKWRGTELFYMEGDTLRAVPVETRSGFSVGIPRKLFTGAQVRATPNSMYDVPSVRGGAERG